MNDTQKKIAADIRTVNAAIAKFPEVAEQLEAHKTELMAKFEAAGVFTFTRF